jgi:hypothetical protein
MLLARIHIKFVVISGPFGEKIQGHGFQVAFKFQAQTVEAPPFGSEAGSPRVAGGFIGKQETLLSAGGQNGCLAAVRK